MTRMFDLGDVLELINDGLDDGAFPQQKFVQNRPELVLHVGSDASDELKIDMAEKFFKEWLRNITFVANEFAEKVMNWHSVIDIPKREFHIQDFASISDNQMQLETEKPAHRVLTTFNYIFENAVLWYSTVVTDIQTC